MTTKHTPAPRRAGTSKRRQAERLARQVMRDLANDPEALALVLETARILAKRARDRR